MSIPLDDRHPIARERIAHLNEMIARAGGVTARMPLHEFARVNGIVDPAQAAAIEEVVTHTTRATERRIATGGASEAAIAQAVIGAVLFGIRLARKGLV